MKYFALRSIFPLIVAIFFIFSCGGGGGGSDPIPLNPNTSPFFVNNIGEVEVDEMQLSVVTISANDNDGDLLQYSLSGNDPSYFSISNQETFNQPPSYFDKNEFSILINVTDNIVLLPNHSQFFCCEFVQIVLEKQFALKKKIQALNTIDQMIIQPGKIGMATIKIIDMKFLN